MPTDSPIAERTGTCLPIASTRSSMSAVTLTSSRPSSPTERTARRRGPRSISSSMTRRSNTTSPSSSMKLSRSTCEREQEQRRGGARGAVVGVGHERDIEIGKPGRDRIADRLLEIAGADHELIEADAQEARDRAAQDRDAMDRDERLGMLVAGGGGAAVRPAARIAAFNDASGGCKGPCSYKFQRG